MITTPIDTILKVLLLASLLSSSVSAWGSGNRVETATPKAAASTVPVSNSMKRCPQHLKAWIEDDFKDKSAWGIKFKSDARICQRDVLNYAQSLQNSSTQRSGLDVQSLRNQLSSRFATTINPFFKSTLELCDQELTDPAMALAAPTRFYSSAT